MYVSTKRYGHEAGFSIAYRQHRADSHCKYIHGYSLAFEFEFESPTLDIRNWVVDFGSLRTLKEFLTEHFDHTLLVAEDDPELDRIKVLDVIGIAQVREVEKTGCEGIVEFLFWYVNEVWMSENGYSPRVFCRKVRVFETPNNSAYIEYTRSDWANKMQQDKARKDGRLHE